MSGGSSSKGYTIIEVLIVVAVTSLLLVMATQLISGQQAKTQFTQAVRTFEARLQQIANDVSTGFYPNVGKVSCTTHASAVTSLPPTVSTSVIDAGTNNGCVFVGQVIQFQSSGSAGDHSDYKIYTIIGNRQYGNAATNVPLREAQSLAETMPVILPDAAAAEKMTGSVEVRDVYYFVPPAYTSPTTIGDIAFYSTFGQYSGGNLVSGTTAVNIAGLGSLGGSPPAPASIGGTGVNPARGLTVCLAGPKNQFANITIGGNGRRLTTEVSYRTGSCT